jgi:hypothetical protein
MTESHNLSTIKYLPTSTYNLCTPQYNSINTYRSVSRRCDVNFFLQPVEVISDYTVLYNSDRLQYMTL